MKKNIASFRVVDPTTGEILMQASRYRYFYLATVDTDLSPTVSFEAVTDEGETIKLDKKWISNGLEDFEKQSAEPVALESDGRGFFVVPQ